MRVISQRELRNDNASIVRAVEEGESFTITRHGVPVARLTPMPSDDGLRCLRPARPGTSAGDLRTVNLPEPTESILDELRADR